MNVKLRPASKRETLDYFGTVMEEEVGCFPVPPPVSPLRIRQNGKAVRIPRPTVVIDSQEHMGCLLSAESIHPSFHQTELRRTSSAWYIVQDRSLDRVET